MEPLTPIYTTGLFPGLHAELIALLRGLDDAPVAVECGRVINRSGTFDQDC
jgi:hypothetical protein